MRHMLKPYFQLFSWTYTIVFHLSTCRDRCHFFPRLRPVREVVQAPAETWQSHQLIHMDGPMSQASEETADAFGEVLGHGSMQHG